MTTETAPRNSRIVNPQAIMPRGIDDFAEARPQGNSLVDKTLFVRGVLTCHDKIALITRPRRFGKTINMGMLRTFFETPQKGADTKALFDGLLVGQDAATMEHQGKYPVISLTLKSAKLPNVEVKCLYKELIDGWFAQEPRREQTTSMVKALMAGDGELFIKRLQTFVLASMSYFAVSKRDPERVYQAFVLGLLVQLEQDYRLRSEREAGGGRADVLLIPKQPNKPGSILEFKLAEDVCEEKDQAKNRARGTAANQRQALQRRVCRPALQLCLSCWCGFCGEEFRNGA